MNRTYCVERLGYWLNQGIEFKIGKESLVWRSNTKLNTECSRHGLSFQNHQMVEEKEMMFLPFKVLRIFVSISYSYSAYTIRL